MIAASGWPSSRRPSGTSTTRLPVICSPIPAGCRPTGTDRFENWQPSPGPNGYLLPSYNYQSLLKIPARGGLDGRHDQRAPRVDLGRRIVAVAAVAVVLVFRGRGRRRAEEA